MIPPLFTTEDFDFAARTAEPMARDLAGQVITDFLADHLAARQDRA